MSDSKPDVPTIDEIMAWEDGSMDYDETVDFFQRLVNSGLAWKLQGVYGRTAQQLIDGGHIHAPKI